jgi:hypothetical protein
MSKIHRRRATREIIESPWRVHLTMNHLRPVREQQTCVQCDMKTAIDDANGKDDFDEA